ncbi:hypothetical protein SAMN05216299_11578 [Nitrosospira sp. Nsp14]|nr:hypothetical protein SAMN05216299_11578 [Nitrosospira sp. Nsp14]
MWGNSGFILGQTLSNAWIKVREILEGPVFSLLIIVLWFIPILMGYLIRGRILDEQKNPLNRFLIAAIAACWNAYCISCV